MSLLAVVVLACTPPIPQVGDVLPANGLTGVPSNAAIVFESTVRDGTASAMVVVTSGLGGYSGAAVVDPASGVFVFDPGAPLGAGNWSAFITITSPGGEAFKGVSFTAVSATDEAGPVFTGDVAFDIGTYVDVGAIEDCPDPPGVYAVHSDWPDATDGSALFYAVRGQLFAASEATIAAPAGETFALEVYAFDAAGNVTALPVATLDVPGPPGGGGDGCSCAMEGEGRAPLAPVLLLLIAGLTLSRRTAILRT